MMYINKQVKPVPTFRHFNRKGWSLFSSLHREVRIGVLSVATLISAAPRLLQATPMQQADILEASKELAADTLELAEVGVTASRAPLAAAVAARQVVTLTASDLAAAGVQSINDALKLAAGVDVRQRGGFGIQTDISILGGTHDQLCILLNGVPLVNPQTGHLTADFPVNLTDIARIEVLQGAASRVMGSQAFSGAINIVTKSMSRQPLEAMLEGGSYATMRSELRTSWKLGKGWGATASGSWQRSDGAVTNGDFKGGKGYGHLLYNGPKISFGLQAGASANDFGANTFYSAAYPDQWESTRRYMLSVSAETQGRIHFSPCFSWIRSTDHYQLTRHSTKGENFHRNDVLTASFNAWTDWMLGRTALGAEWRKEAIYSTNLGYPLDEAEYEPVKGQQNLYYTRHADRTNISAFVEHNIVWRKLTLSMGVMAGLNKSIDRSVRFYPGVDLSYRLLLGLKFYASWNMSQRLPTFTDLWYKSPTQEGNAGLRPEKNSAFMLGADYSRTMFRISARAHYQRGSHIIDWVMRSPDDKYHATSFGLDNFGLAVDARLNFNKWFGSEQPIERMTLSYVWLHQHRRRGEDYYKSNYAMEYLRHKFVATLSHRIISKLSAEWTLRVQQRQGAYLVYRNLKPTGELHPYGAHALLDCSLRWNAPQYSLYVDLTNLTAHRYFDLANVRQPGLMVLGGIRFRL